MININITTRININFETATQNFNLKLFEQLLPKFPKAIVLRFDGNTINDEIHVQLAPKLIWKSKIINQTQNETLWSFTDEGIQIPWPLTKWIHHHSIEKIAENDINIIDDINFETIKGFNHLIKPMLIYQFSLRPKLYKSYFNQLQK